MRNIILGACLGALTIPAWAENQTDACSNYIKAQDYSHAIEQAKAALKDDMNSIASYICLGQAYYKTGQFKLALQVLKEAEIRSKSKRERSLAYNGLGLVYIRIGDMESALLYHERDLALSRELGDKLAEAMALNNLAEVYQSKGDVDRALNYFQQVIALTENGLTKAVSYSNMGVIYLERGNAAKAIELLTKAVELSRHSGSVHQVAQWQINLGVAHLMANDYIKAEEAITAGLKGVQEVGDRYWEAQGYQYLGLLRLKQGKTSMAKMGLARAQEIFTEIGAIAAAQEVGGLMIQIEGK